MGRFVILYGSNNKVNDKNNLGPDSWLLRYNFIFELMKLPESKWSIDRHQVMTFLFYLTTKVSYLIPFQDHLLRDFLCL